VIIITWFVIIVQLIKENNGHSIRKRGRNFPPPLPYVLRVCAFRDYNSYYLFSSLHCLRLNYKLELLLSVFMLGCLRHYHIESLRVYLATNSVYSKFIDVKPVFIFQHFDSLPEGRIVFRCKS
jgi:hypothetical protein